METAFYYSNALSDPYEVSHASNAHVNYLKYGPYVRSASGQIVHSLFIDRDDFESLFENGTGGLKLYFCRRTDALGKTFVSIVCVPVDTAYENVLENADSSTALVDNLEPCPDKCKKAGPPVPHSLDCSEKDLNYEIIGGLKAWCKPNLKTADGKIWFDVTGNPVQ